MAARCLNPAACIPRSIPPTPAQISIDAVRKNEARRHLCISVEQARQRREHPQRCLLDAVAAAPLQEPAAARHPAHRRSEVPPEEEPERQPERTACAALRVAAAQPRVVGGHPGLFASVVSPDHVRGNRKALEIRYLQLSLSMSGRQVVERVAPFPTRERAASSLASISDGHEFTICPDVSRVMAQCVLQRPAPTAAIGRTDGAHRHTRLDAMARSR
jgi:hypothetical protein